jgi:hypothetical protein
MKKALLIILVSLSHNSYTADSKTITTPLLPQSASMQDDQAEEQPNSHQETSTNSNIQRDSNPNGRNNCNCDPMACGVCCLAAAVFCAHCH